MWVIINFSDCINFGTCFRDVRRLFFSVKHFFAHYLCLFAFYIWNVGWSLSLIFLHLFRSHLSRLLLFLFRICSGTQFFFSFLLLSIKFHLILFGWRGGIAVKTALNAVWMGRERALIFINICMNGDTEGSHCQNNFMLAKTKRRCYDELNNKLYKL